MVVMKELLRVFVIVIVCLVASSLQFTIVSPPALAQLYPNNGRVVAVPASFSAPLPAPPGITAPVVLAQPNTGCINYTNAADVRGKVVLVNRGACTFWVKAQIANQLGALAMIVINLTPDMFQMIMADVDRLPMYSVLIGSTDGANMINYLSQNVSINIAQTPVTAEDRATLMDLYNSTNGPNWEDQGTPITGWGSDLDACSWDRVFCFDDGKIQGLLLEGSNLNGVLPSSLATLTSLSTLNLASNSLKGTIPEWLGSLTNLNRLTLDGNYFIGSLPESLSSLKLLQILHAGSNQLVGSIPESYSKLTALQELTLDSNSLEGTLPSTFSTLSKLTIFSVNNNKLSGSFPQSLASAWTLLTRLSLSYNQFNGTLPPQLRYPALQALDISWNSFAGSVPSLINCSSLFTLDISHNDFQGTVPGTSAFPLSLRYFTANHNQFHTIATDFFNMLNLEQVDLSFNMLNGSNTDTLYRMPVPSNTTAQPQGLISIDLSHNLITTPVSLELHLNWWPRLVYLNLAHNQMDKELFMQPIVHNTIATIDVSNNRLNGTLSKSFGILPTLRRLSVQGNRLYHGSDALLPSYLTPDPSLVTLNSTGMFECPSIIGIGSSLIVQLDASYYDFSFCKCFDGYRRVQWAPQLQCVICPDHIICDNQNRPNDSYFEFEGGYYPTPNEEDPQMMLVCPECSRTTSPVFECPQGHEGRMCDKCQYGYFKRSQTCVSCKPIGTIVTVVVIAIVCLLMVVFVIAFTKWSNWWNPTGYLAYLQNNAGEKWSDKPEKSNSPSMWKRFVKYMMTAQSFAVIFIAINYYQTLSIIGKMLNMSDTYTVILSVMDISTVNASGFGLECLHEVMTDFYGQYLLVIIQPVAIVLIGTIVYCFGWLFFLITKQEKQEWWKFVCARWGLLLLVFVYFPVATTTISALNCTEDPVTGISYISAHPYAECGSIPTSLKWIACLGYCIGIMGLFIFLLWKFNNGTLAQQESLLKCFGFYFEQFKPKRIYYSNGLMMRRLILSVINGTLTEHPLVLFVCNGVVISVSSMAALLIKPYIKPVDNLLEVISDLVLLLCYSILFVVALHQNYVLSESQASSADVTAMEIIFLIVNVFLTLWICWLIIISRKKLLKQTTRKLKTLSLSLRRSVDLTAAGVYLAGSGAGVTAGVGLPSGDTNNTTVSSTTVSTGGKADATATV